MVYENIIVEQVEKGIVKITLNRPRVLNAMNSALLTELRQALGELERDEDVAVVILTGAGRAFSAGMDLKETGHFYEWKGGSFTFSLLRNLKCPVIAAVNGYAITGGFELAMACDIVVASENAAFRDTHAQVRVLPGGGNTQRLPRLVGEKKAKEILFTSDFIPAAEAARIGLVNRVVPPERLEEEVLQLARKIAVQPKDIISKMKQVINEGMNMDFGAAMMYEQLESRAWRAQMTPEDIAQQGRGVIKGGRAEVRKEQG